MGYLKFCISIKIDIPTTGKISSDQRIYISSLDTDANTLNKAITKHWSVENNLHWTLDVLFKEDASRKRKNNTAEYLNIVLEVR